MTMNDEAFIDLNEKTDLLPVLVECPVCHDKYLHGSPYVQVPCNKCGTSYKTDLKQDIYTKMARRLNGLLAWHNKITIRATEPYERDLMSIKEHFNRMGNWSVSEAERKNEEYRFCKNCGICLGCFTCKECGHHFEKDKNRRKQRCPKCGKTNFTKTYFTNALPGKTKHTLACPHCKSEHVKMTRTTRKTKCHKCGSAKLSEPRVNVIYTLTIERLKSYRIENI